MQSDDMEFCSKASFGLSLRLARVGILTDEISHRLCQCQCHCQCSGVVAVGYDRVEIGVKYPSIVPFTRITYPSATKYSTNYHIHLVATSADSEKDRLYRIQSFSRASLFRTRSLHSRACARLEM